MIDHVRAMVRIMLIGLDVATSIFGPSQQGVLPRLVRRQPIKLPTPPSMPLGRVEEFGLGPDQPTVRADCDLGYLGLASPCSAEHRVDLVRIKRLVNTGPDDLRLQLDRSERAPYRLSV